MFDVLPNVLDEKGRIFRGKNKALLLLKDEVQAVENSLIGSNSMGEVVGILQNVEADLESEAYICEQLGTFLSSSALEYIAAEDRICQNAQGKRGIAREY